MHSVPIPHCSSLLQLTLLTVVQLPIWWLRADSRRVVPNSFNVKFYKKNILIIAKNLNDDSEIYVI